MNDAQVRHKTRVTSVLFHHGGTEAVVSMGDVSFARATGPAATPETWLSLTKPSRIAIKAKGRILFIDPADVVTVEAHGNYVLLRRMSGSDLLRESMSNVAEGLHPYGFVRIHRSVLINTSFVEEVRPLTTGGYVLRIKGGKEFRVSRTYKKNLRSITPLWFGTNGFRRIQPSRRK